MSDKKSRYRELDKESKLISRDKEKILQEDGYMEKSHTMIWVLIIVIIIVAVLWYFFFK